MDPAHSVLLTDLYELTMLEAYFDHGLEETAVFELFVRTLPAERNFLVAAGLEQALSFLEELAFTEEELGALQQTRLFRPRFLQRLETLRFTGDVHAVPEGTIFFAGEPILRVTAPLPEAQLVESRLMNLLHFESVIASKAARVVLAAPGKLLVDFGMRRAHGAEAAILAARASYLAGFDGTSTVLAALLFGIPIFGTMAHSFVQAHGDEAIAFEHFAASRPENTTMLLDTYDTEAAARKVVELFRRGRIPRPSAVRLDSGDLAMLARNVREVLDRGGLEGVRIFSSGGLDEHRIQSLVQDEAPIDGFGVGTAMDTSADAPYLDCAYKLVEYANQPRRKLSEGKVTWPGRKQIHRIYDARGAMLRDVLTIDGDRGEGEPLIIPVMKSGRRITTETLEQIRQRVRSELERLPSSLRILEPAPPHAVVISKALADLTDTLGTRR